MNKNLLFNFTVDKATNTVHVTRAFNGNLQLVWNAWTKPEILDQWWAPKPYKAVTKSMDFREGGTWLYYMQSPANEKHWCKNEYQKITPLQQFSGLDAFCNEEGVINTAMPRTLWTNTFTEQDGLTTVSIVAVYNSLADLETVIAMGFEQGFTMALQNLDEVLESLSS
jgi:PhnB protein